MEGLLRLVAVSFPVTMPSNSEEETNAAANAYNIVATKTVANSEVTPPQDNVGLDMQSQLEFRSAASGADQSEPQRDAVFSQTPQTQLHVADGSQIVPQAVLWCGVLDP